MDSLPKIINQYPELLNITKPSCKNGIFYSEERYTSQFIEALISIYKFYFEIEPVVIVPRQFSEKGTIGTLEFLENFTSFGKSSTTFKIENKLL